MADSPASGDDVQTGRAERELVHVCLDKRPLCADFAALNGLLVEHVAVEVEGGDAGGERMNEQGDAASAGAEVKETRVFKGRNALEGGEQVAVYILGGDEAVVSGGLGGVDAGVVIGGEGHGDGTGRSMLRPYALF